MPARLPTPADFPPNITLTITPPPPSHPPTNILLLLHGLGDTHLPFHTLGTQLALPDTACIAIRGPTPLPFDLGGYHWADDLSFTGTGEMEADSGFAGAGRVLAGVMAGLEGCGYTARDVVVFGFGQGGMVGLGFAAGLEGAEEMGGVVSVGGRLAAGVELKSGKGRTPVLVCRAARGSEVTDGAVRKLRDAFEFVEVKEWRRNGDGMPSSREEMLPIMQFFARRLRSARGVPEGSVEIR
ncbi:Alpha/Beta hydrolase protein [Boeremia exigua]|uniref:Alpha/Beta hydrolase protein n=1 Tax=Boeremia exigua TaxID=749465 RepID=UPI001E8E98E9|nr:Alpha/Beta hydrolase protein [Boeremia exigua]KAH6638857.1 Alpha/Beta hydrolase protein [Boeremia exigua]